MQPLSPYAAGFLRQSDQPQGDSAQPPAATFGTRMCPVCYTYIHIDVYTYSIRGRVMTWYWPS